MSILSLLYPEHEIYLIDITFSEPPSTAVTFKLPLHGYFKQGNDYVTAENYMRCLSQACYLTVYQSIKEDWYAENLEEEDFKKRLAEGLMYFRDMRIKFKKKMSKKDPVALKIKLLSSERVGKFIKYSLEITSEAISGTITCVC